MSRRKLALPRTSAELLVRLRAFICLKREWVLSFIINKVLGLDEVQKKVNMSPTRKPFEEELIEVLQDIRGELIRIGEILQDTALPKATQINVREK